MQVDTIKQRYEKAPNKWNISVMLSLGGILWAAMAFFISAQFTDHSINVDAHPQMTVQLNRMEANQISEKIEKMDARICLEPGNNFYRIELRDLIIEWEKLTGDKYPTQLLRCANGA